ncbi:MAG: MATE family efflux transporter [Nitrospirae bacterium]|nr:MATE family efflux transporter [Nitrospirota bacterium]
MPHQREIRHELFSLAIPVVFSSLLQRAVNVMGVFLVGGLGASAIAAVGIGQFLILMVMTSVWGLSAGTTVVVAQLWGAERRTEAAHVGLQAILVGALLGLGISLAGVGLGQWGAVFLGAPPEVLVFTEPYLRIIFSFFVFSLLVNLLSAIMYGTADSRPPLRAAVLMNVLYFAMAYPLVHGLWGVPALGVAGAALASGLSEMAAALYLLVVGFQKGYLRRGAADRALLRQVFHVGLPVFAERLVQQAGQMMFLKAVMLYGTAAYAAHQVVLTIEAFSFLPGLGISLAVTSAVGRILGANQPHQVALVHREANRLAIVIMGGMGLVFFWAPDPLLRMFTADPEVIRLGTSFLKIAAILQIPLAITMVLSGSLKGSGDTPFLFWSTVAGSWGVRIPFAWLFASVLKLDIAAVWSLMVVDWFVRMCLLMYRYRSKGWITRNIIQPYSESPSPALAPVRECWTTNQK